jgi:hypothetical protein
MDTSPTALFDSYEQDFKQFIDTIRDKLDDTTAGTAPSDRGKHTTTSYLPTSPSDVTNPQNSARPPCAEQRWS